MTTLDLLDCGSERLDQVMGIMADAFDPAFGEAWTHAQCSGILIMPGVWMTVARHGADAAGFSIARHVAGEAELLLLAVRSDCRRKGVGSALLRRFCAAAAARGARRVHLEMRDGNDAGAMYRAAGFEQVGRRRDYYRGTSVQSFDALTLSRSLC